MHKPLTQLKPTLPKSISIPSQSQHNKPLSKPTFLSQLISSTCYANYMHVMLCNAMQKKPKNHAQRDKVSSPGLMVSEPTALIPNCHAPGF